MSINNKALYDLLKFLLPSMVGVALFLTPVVYQGSAQILVGILANELRLLLTPVLALIINGLYLLSAIVSIYYSLIGRSSQSPTFIEKMFTTTPVWLLLRVLAGVFCTMVVWGLGPEWVVNEATGQVAYIEFSAIIFCIMLVANFLLPLLTDFGFIELIGTLVRRPFHLFFKLPGRAAVDAITSWVGDSSVGALLTIRQYEQGLYSAKQAAAVVTSFSAVSLPFTVVITQMAKLQHVFVEFYFATLICGIICAVIIPRLKPLSSVAESYFQSPQAQVPHVTSNVWADAYRAAIIRASNAPSIKAMLKNAVQNIADIFIAVLPAAMTIEFIALVLVEYSSVLTWLSYPMLPIFNLLQIPEAELAVAGSLVGFFDQFIPVVIASSIDSPVTRFVLAGLSVTQLIFIAENGILILRSSIPLSLGQLAIIFMIRTAISLPILALIAHMLF